MRKLSIEIDRKKNYQKELHKNAEVGREEKRAWLAVEDPYPILLIIPPRF